MTLNIGSGIRVGGGIRINISTLTLTFTYDQISDVLGTLGDNGLDPGSAALLGPLTEQQQTALDAYASEFGADGSFSELWTATWSAGSTQNQTYIAALYGPEYVEGAFILYVLDDVGNLYEGTWNWPVICYATPGAPFIP